MLSVFVTLPHDERFICTSYDWQSEKTTLYQRNVTYMSRISSKLGRGTGHVNRKATPPALHQDNTKYTWVTRCALSRQAKADVCLVISRLSLCQVTSLKFSHPRTSSLTTPYLILMCLVSFLIISFHFFLHVMHSHNRASRLNGEEW